VLVDSAGKERIHTFTHLEVLYGKIDDCGVLFHKPVVLREAFQVNYQIAGKSGQDVLITKHVKRGTVGMGKQVTCSVWPSNFSSIVNRGIWGMMFFSASPLKRGGGGNSIDRYLVQV